MVHINPNAISALMGALDSADFQVSHPRPGAAAPPGVRPFVTISRQAGIGGRALATRLVDRLNAVDPGDVPWNVWDRELVVQVASKYHLPVPHVAALEDERPSWLAQLVGALTLGQLDPGPEELTVYHRMVRAIRALAEIGRVVVVGYGAAFITSDITGGVHARVVAPEDWRIAAAARSRDIPEQAAAAHVRKTDRNREAFYRRHFAERPVTPEQFTVVFNAAAVDPDQMVASLIPLIVKPRNRG